MSEKPVDRFAFIDWDKRILDQRTKNHQLTPMDFLRYLKTLPDEKDRSDEQIVYKESDSEGRP